MRIKSFFALLCTAFLLQTNTSFAQNKEDVMNNIDEIYFAGGCFWGVEEYFSRIEGVVDAQSGYANGSKENPSYEEVVSGRYGFAETVLVKYEKDKVQLNDLVRYYFMIIDPLSVNKQGNDRGIQYRTGVYYTDLADKSIIEDVFKSEQKKYKEPIKTELMELKNFYLAEDYHQDYLQKNKNGYCHINFDVLKEIEKERAAKEESESKGALNTDKYKNFNKEEALKKLTELQYAVTQHSVTERPYSNEYDNFFEKGIYVDVVSNEPLFLSKDKFDSGCGWPAFSKPISDDALREYVDLSHGMQRVEVKSKYASSHLGHVFNDGPKELGSMRYCINSAALKFIPYDKMDELGYGEYKKLLD